MRILHILDHSVPLHSGYSFRTLALLNEQRRLGWDPIALTSSKHMHADDDADDVDDVDGFRFYRTRPTASLLGRLPLLEQLAVIRDTERRLDELVPVLRPQILHAHSPCLNGFAALRVARRRGLPVVYEVRAFWEDAAVDHGTTTEGSLRYRSTRALETSVLRRADAVTTICEGLRRDILGRGVPRSRVTVIPNGVDIEAFPMIDKPNLALKAQLGLQDAVVIGFIGSFYAYEGLDVLIEALPAMLRLEPRIRLLLVGGGKEEERLRSRALQLGVQDRILMPGRVPHSEVNRYYSLVDLLAFPRRSMRLTETVTPLKPLEAMAQGKLVIASSVGGHRELIDDGETGFLFAPDNSGALVDCVRHVLARRSAWASVQARARNFVEAQRTWAASAAHYASVYALVAATTARAGRSTNRV